jgi:hypothetical protein
MAISILMAERHASEPDTCGNRAGDSDRRSVVSMRALKWTLPVVVALAFLAGCGGDDDDGEDEAVDVDPAGIEDPRITDLNDHREQWDEAKPPSYQFTVARVCFCPVEFSQPRVVTVRDGQPVSVEPAPLAEGDVPRTMDELFDVIEQAIGEADAVNVEYDDELGYPVRVDVDVIEEAIDDEQTYEVSAFQSVD